MAIGGAFLGGGVEVVPAGSCKLELEILTEDRANLTATFTIKGTSTYTVTAGADGRAVYTVPSGQTYTVSVNTTGYDNLASQTVVAESGTVRYVRFEAIAGRVKRSGDTMTGGLSFRSPNQIAQYIDNQTLDKKVAPSSATTIWYVQTRDKNNQPFGNVIAHSMEADGRVTWTFGQNATTWQGLTVVKPLSGQPYATVPTPSSSSDNSTKIATTAWISTADCIVHKTGNETVAGEKTLTSRTRFVMADYVPILIRRTDLDVGVADDKESYIYFNDKNSTLMGRFGVANYENKTVNMSTQWGGTWYSLGLRKNASDGSVTGVAPTTPTNATGNEIATADWVISKLAAGKVVNQAITYSLESDKKKIRLTNVQMGDMISFELKFGDVDCSVPCTIVPTIDIGAYYQMAETIGEQEVYLQKDSTGYFLTVGSVSGLGAHSHTLTGNLIRF